MTPTSVARGAKGIDTMTLSEQYRPRKLDGVIGQPKSVAAIRRIAQRGIGGRAFWITLTNQGLTPAFAKRAREIAEAEGLNGKPEAAHLRLVQRCRNNMRAVLQAVESGEMLE
jgi:hypothetical protein